MHTPEAPQQTGFNSVRQRITKGLAVFAAAMAIGGVVEGTGKTDLVAGVGKDKTEQTADWQKDQLPESSTQRIDEETTEITFIDREVFSNGAPSTSYIQRSFETIFPDLLTQDHVIDGFRSKRRAPAITLSTTAFPKLTDQGLVNSPIDQKKLVDISEEFHRTVDSAQENVAVYNNRIKIVSRNNSTWSPREFYLEHGRNYRQLRGNLLAGTPDPDSVYDDFWKAEDESSIRVGQELVNKYLIDKGTEIPGILPDDIFVRFIPGWTMSTLDLMYEAETPITTNVHYSDQVYR